MYQIEYSKSVKKFFKHHPELIRRFFEKAKILEKDPFDKSLDVKKYHGIENCYRLRVGKYRFLYEIIEHKLVIYMYGADSRGDVYK